MSNLILIEILLPATGFVKPIHSGCLGMRRCTTVAYGEESLGLQLEADKDWPALTLYFVSIPATHSSSLLSSLLLHRICFVFLSNSSCQDNMRDWWYLEFIFQCFITFWDTGIETVFASISLSGRWHSPSPWAKTVLYTWRFATSVVKTDSAMYWELVSICTSFFLGRGWCAAW